MKKHKAIFNWSGGKDSAHALWKVLSTDAYDVVSLLTAVEAQTQCSSLHNIPAKVFVQQARSIGLPLYIVQSTPAEYATAISQFKSKGVTHFIFGDIFLTEVRQYREQQLHPWGIKVNRVELKNIIPPAAIQDAMEKQMKAERERREQILIAEGEKKSAILRAEGHKESVILEAEADKQAAILKAEAAKEAMIREAEGEAQAILNIQQANADGLRFIKEVAADDSVIKLKSLEAFEKAADGKATKIIIPSEIQGLAGMVKSLTEVAADVSEK